MKANEVFQNKKKNKKKNKNKKNLEKLRCFALKPEHGPRGLRRKPLKPGALNQLVGIQRLNARYMGGWVELASYRCWILEIIRSPGLN